MVLISSASESATIDFCKQMRLTVPFLSDPSEKLERLLNVIWYGRPYLYSQDWKLRWLSQQSVADGPFSDSSFLREIGRNSR